MELLLLMYLLSTLDADPALKNSLKSFLSFYKENRDLIASLASAGAPASVSASVPAGEVPPADVPKEREGVHAQEKSRPREEAGVMNVLEEYLRRASV